ncbi:hypothetical protein TNCV_4991371 [Trichonephila clavipes]|nr:hypothetical protein TNCV_4991371 [Trichonephila clavipes]
MVILANVVFKRSSTQSEYWRGPRVAEQCDANIHSLIRQLEGYWRIILKPRSIDKDDPRAETLSLLYLTTPTGTYNHDRFNVHQTLYKAVEVRTQLATSPWMSEGKLKSQYSATQGLLATDLVILNHGQVRRTMPELAPSTNGRTFDHRQIQRASFHYTAGLQWYWSPFRNDLLQGLIAVSELVQPVIRFPTSQGNFDPGVKHVSCTSSMLESNYTRAFGNGPRNFEPWSNDVNDTCAGTPSPNYHTTPTGGRFSSRQIYRASLPYTAGL